MQPNNDNNRSVSVPRRDQPVSTHKPDRELAAALMHEQINKIYDQPSSQPTVEISQPKSETNDPTAVESPYQQTQDSTPSTVETSDWEKYHTAWQQYYQQYYHRYYLSQQQAQAQPSQQPTTATPAAAQSLSQSISQDQAVSEIRGDLLSRVKQQSGKIRRNRHFVPIISALIVMMLFMFLQYNRVMVAQVKAYVSPGSISPENVLIDTTSTVATSKDPRIIIPKINVDAPLVYGVGSLAEGPVQEALKDGVIHYPIPGASSVPGQTGNSVFLGHSSNDVFDDGDYKFVFVQLENLKERDTFYINHEGTRYTYTVTGTEEILPTEVQKLVTNSDKPTITLVTCTPVGTALKRFLVHAEQISPDPTSAQQRQNAQEDVNEPAAISGNSPTLFERLFGS